MLLSLPRGWTDSTRENALATALLMFAPVTEALQARTGLQNGRYTLDLRLFSDAYASCPQALRPRLMASPPAQFLPPAGFRRMFMPTFRQPGTDVHDTVRMLWSLEAFLGHHPRLGERYKGVILETFRSPEASLCASGLRMAGAFLRHLDAGDLRRLRARLDSTKPLLRDNALWAIRAFVERADKVDRQVLAFCTAVPIRRRVEALARRGPDRALRSAASSVLAALNTLSAPAV